MRGTPRLTVIALLGLALASRPAAAQNTPAAPPAGGPPATSQTPTFRAGVDLVTVDVTILDREGRPVEDLRPEDFTVRVDGTTRRVVAAELVKAGSAASTTRRETPGTVRLASGSAPASAPAGRTILLAIDQLQIPPGSLKPLLDAAGRFLDGLTPRDRVGLVTFPGPGPRVEFTTDKDRVKKGMQGLIGLSSLATKTQLNIGLAEARAITARERNQVTTAAVGSMDDLRTPVLRDVAARNCDPTDPEQFKRCVVQVINESGEIAQRSRADAKNSIGALQSIVESLEPIDGPKAVVLVSAGLAIEEPRDLEGVISRAEASRTSFSVLIIDPFVDEPNAVAGLVHNQAPTTNDDRRLRNEGLEELAADGRGAVYRVAGRGDGIFERIALELSASYVLGVESIAADAGRTRRRVEIAVKRPGARVRSGQAYVRVAPSRPRTMDEILRQTLESGAEAQELPVRVATYTTWDPAGEKVRLSLAADITRSAITTEFAVGYVVVNRDNQSAAESLKQAKPTGEASSGTLSFAESVLLDPGDYSVRFSVVTPDGKRTSVVRPLQVTRAPGTTEMGSSDLMIGNGMPQDQPPRLAAEPRVASGIVGAYLELYAGAPEDLDWTFVQFEVAKDEGSPALAMADGDLKNGARPSWRLVTGAMDVRSLPPGNYVARARITQDDKTIRVVTRPFVIE